MHKTTEKWSRAKITVADHMDNLDIMFWNEDKNKLDEVKEVQNLMISNLEVASCEMTAKPTTLTVVQVICPCAYVNQRSLYESAEPMTANVAMKRLVGCAHAQNDPCLLMYNFHRLFYGFVPEIWKKVPETEQLLQNGHLKQSRSYS